jgi:hypothetical protein
MGLDLTAARMQQPHPLRCPHCNGVDLSATSPIGTRPWERVLIVIVCLTCERVFEYSPEDR